jgi:glucose-1-phosphate cytidylyltransferase
MKAVILAGGFGTRLSELTYDLPKPLVLIDDKPIIVHLMLHLSKFGINDFIILAGYKGWMFKEYFRNYHSNSNDFTINISTGDIRILKPAEGYSASKNWSVSIIDTGINTMTGGRIKRIQNLIGENENFLLTYGDGLSNVDISELVRLHESKSNDLTVTAVNPPARFGSLQIKDSVVTSFSEKPKESQDFINGGFMISNSKIFDYIENDQTILEREPMSQMSQTGKLGAFIHTGFWQCMDTKRDLDSLKEIVKSGDIPWL